MSASSIKKILGICRVHVNSVLKDNFGYFHLFSLLFSWNKFVWCFGKHQWYVPRSFKVFGTYNIIPLLYGDPIDTVWISTCSNSQLYLFSHSKALLIHYDSSGLFSPITSNFRLYNEHLFQYLFNKSYRCYYGHFFFFICTVFLI